MDIEYTFLDETAAADFAWELEDNCGALVDCRVDGNIVIASGDADILLDWRKDARVMASREL